MEKIQQYRTALDAAVYIRQFMYGEKVIEGKDFLALDFALQPFIDAVLASVAEMIPKPKSDEKND